MSDSAFPPVQLDEYPFPFVGAGEAQYFEWAEVHVVFERPPDEAERAAISETVPAPLTDSVDFDGVFLMVASDQFAHIAMAETYEADEDDLEEDSEEDFGRFFFAKVSQVHKFNEDTDRWLKAAHEICPILAAFRAEDWEAGGTELSTWHDWSVARSDHILDQFDHAAAVDDDHPGNFVLTRLLQVFADEERDIPEELLDVVDPGRLELEQLEAGDSDGLFAALQNRQARREPVLQRLIGALEEENAAHRVAAAGLIRFIDTMEHPPSDAFQPLTDVLIAGEDDGLLAALCRVAAKTEWGTAYIGHTAYHYIQQQRWPDAARVFDVLIAYDSKDLSVFNNALYAIMADNTGLAVQPERARRYIDAARPHGEENPSIFYNIACAEMELGNEDAVLENVELALKWRYDKPEQIREEAVFGDLRQDPRFLALFDE